MISEKNPFYKLIYQKDNILKIFLLDIIDNKNYILGIDNKEYYFESFKKLSDEEKNIVHQKLKNKYLSQRLILGF